MSSFPNPNVDRLSIDERLRRLEVGGSSGGGSGGIARPDFDALPDNAFSLVKEGLVFKFSDPNVGATYGMSTAMNIGFKLCTLIPYKAGILATPPFVMVRFHYATNIPNLQQNLATINKEITIDWAAIKDRILYTVPPSGGSLVSLSFNPGGQLTDGTWTSRAFRFGLNVQALNPNVTNKCTVQFHCGKLDSVPITGRGLKAGYSFAADFVIDPYQTLNLFGSASIWTGNYQLPVGGRNMGQSITVASLSQLPQFIKDVYPKSWCQ